MPAYLIVRVQITNPDAYEDYKRLAAPAIEQYGGHYLARGGRTVTLEGPQELGRIVVVEFPSFEQAQTFYRSSEYQKAIEMRTGAATGQFVVVEGLP